MSEKKLNRLTPGMAWVIRHCGADFYYKNGRLFMETDGISVNIGTGKGVDALLGLLRGFCAEDENINKGLTSMLK